MLQKIVQAGVRNRSYLEGSRELQESAELLINEKAIERVVRRIIKLLEAGERAG